MAKKRKCIEEGCSNLVTRGSKLGRCKSCAAKAIWKRPKYRRKVSKSRRESWKDGVYDDRKNPWEDNPELCAIRSDIALGLWRDPEYVTKRTVAHQAAMGRPEVGAKISARHLTRWQDPEIRPRLLKVRRDVWRDEEFRRRHAEGQKRGVDHYNWQGGKSFEPYGPDFNDELKFQIRTRDAFRCLLCGKLENSAAHDVHHKDYDKKNNDPDNLATLCKSCHGKTGTDRPYWQAYFTGKGYELMLGVC